MRRIQREESMYSVVHTAVLSGIDACLVSVEADISNGMPMFEMVGLLASEVRESKERVRTALKNCQYELPIKRITVNLAPANIRKSGSGFDLPVAVAVLALETAAWRRSSPPALPPWSSPSRS